ncbi:MAG: Fe2+-dependent dioxygenase [Alphaproteobacteria bacterium]|nr:Fe2+-dependent dioxygenase [Alphaproteobacteria bacterium]
MLIVLAGVLEGEDLARVRARLDQAVWRDGKATAGPAARAVKNNLQAPGLADLGAFVMDALKRHPLFEIAARPRRASPVMFSKYEPGMDYGPHTDDALMGVEERLRADLSYTLFLADPESYDGGALTIENAAGEQAIKLAAGDCVLYPSGTIHHVAPVSAGARLAAVGWVQSTIRDAGQREILFDLSMTRMRLANAPREDVLRLDKSISNLLRMWAEV